MKERKVVGLKTIKIISKRLKSEGQKAFHDGINLQVLLVDAFRQLGLSQIGPEVVAPWKQSEDSYKDENKSSRRELKVDKKCRRVFFSLALVKTHPDLPSDVFPFFP